MKKQQQQLALEYYIKLGKDRTIKAVAEHMDVNPRNVYRWAKKRKWKEQVDQKIIDNTNPTKVTKKYGNKNKNGKSNTNGKISLEVIGSLTGYIKIGASIKVACKQAGISKETYYNWIDKGVEAEKNDEENLYLYFLSTLKKAEAASIVNSLNEVYKATKKHWQAAAWFLERKCPDEWGRKEKYHHTIEEKIDPEKNSAAILNSLKDPEKRKAARDLLKAFEDVTRSTTDISET